MAYGRLMVVGQNGPFYTHMDGISPSRKHLSTRPQLRPEEMRVILRRDLVTITGELPEYLGVCPSFALEPLFAGVVPC